MVISGSRSTPRDNGKLCISPASPFERTIKVEGARSRDSSHGLAEYLCGASECGWADVKCCQKGLKGRWMKEIWG